MPYIDAIIWECINHELMEGIGEWAIQVSSFGHIHYTYLLHFLKKILSSLLDIWTMNLEFMGDIKTIAVNLAIIGTQSISKSWGLMTCHKRTKELKM